MTYIPTAKDFADDEETVSYRPSASDFSDENSKGFKGILSDLGSATMNAPEQIADIIGSLPEQFGATASQIEEKPFAGTARSIGKLGSGALEGAKGLFNLPLSLAVYLGNKDVPYFKQIKPLAESLRIGNTGLDKFIFGESRAGDVLPQGIGEAIPAFIGSRGASLLNKAGRGAIAGASQEQNPVTGAALALLPDAISRSAKSFAKPIKSLQNARKVKGLEERQSTAQEAFDFSQEQLNAFKDALKEKFGKSEPWSLRREAESGLRRMSEIEKDASRKPIDLEKKLPGATGQGLVEEAQSNVANAIRPIEEYLGRGAEHDVEAAAHINEAVNKRKAEIGDMFNQVQENLAGKTLELRNPRDAKTIINEITELVRAQKSHTPEAVALMDELQGLKETSTIPADRFMSAWRTTDKLAKEARRNAFRRDISRDEHDKFIEQANTLDQKATEMEQILDKGVGSENIELLKKARRRWATEVTPLYRNRIYNDALNKGRIDNADIMKELRGTGEGQDILNQIVSENPFLLRSIVGQRFAENPEGLLNANRRQQRYINQLPQLEGMMNRLSQALGDLSNATSRTEQLRTEAERVSEAFKEDVKNEEQRKKALDEYAKLQKEVDAKTKAAEKLEEALKNKEMSQEKLNQLNAELKAAIDDINKSKSKMIKIVGALLKLAGVKYGVTKLL